MISKVYVTPKCAIRNHDTFREPCGTAGIIDKRHFLWILVNIVMYVFLAEILWELDTEHLVEMLASISQLVGA